ncbi:MAG: hypothetical protein KY462_13105 [Actinobacteria bacterium]|nr:hypothetical protein [Actinomycetota bacterium]
MLRRTGTQSTIHDGHQDDPPLATVPRLRHTDREEAAMVDIIIDLGSVDEDWHYLP